MCYIYILQSQRTKRFYIGHAEEVDHRLQQHNKGYSKSTKSGIPWDLIYTEEFQTRSEAMRRETEIKKMKSRKYILTLIERPQST